ncbi:hypothetical protein B566_EDAN006796 [Ephemera danica]|nr:hypothetical protein B566_EDAN006796 [Ephemera danica]
MGKKSKRKTRWRSLPIGDVSSQNEEECDDELRHEHMELRTKKSTWSRGNQQRYALPQPMHEKSQMFNEDEYTKITTPRQDVLFKKGYLGKRRPQQKPETVVQELQVNAYDQNNAGVEESQSETSSETVTSMQEMLTPIHLYNGFIDPQVGPVFYLNGGYDIYEPYSNVFNSFMIPANAAFPGGGQVLAAVPCQTLPMQPLEWFHTRHDDSWCFVPSTCVPTAVPPNLQRKKRYSTDSQSSDSTGPPSSPQQEEEGDSVTSDLQNPSVQAPYAYQGYVFGSTVSNTEEIGTPRPPSANGVHHSDQSINNGAIVDSAAIGKRRKKKRRRKRRRDCRGDGVVNEGLEEKDLKEDFPKNTTHGPNTVSSIEMKELSIFSGTDSTPTSLPPASSESCSDLSAASASHSHDEMEQTVHPLRPCLNHILESNGAIPMQLSVENQECVTFTNDNSERGNKPLETDMLQDLIRNDGFQQIKDNKANPPVASSSLDETSFAVDGTVDQELNNAINIEAQVIEKQESKLPGPKYTDLSTEKLRKTCKKSKHTRQQQEQCLKQENSPATSLKCTMLETVTSIPVEINLSLQENKTEFPKETTDSSSHVMQGLNILPKEQERLAQNITEHVIADAITNAVKQCTIQESNCVAVKDEKLLTASHGPITLAVTKWLNSSVEPLIIEEEEEEEASGTSEKTDTGSKNGVVNPLPAPSNRFVTVSTDGPEKRVENFVAMFACREKSNELKKHIRKESTSSTASNISSCGEWDLWEDTMALHDPQYSIHDSKLKPLLNEPITLAKVEQEDDANCINAAKDQNSTTPEFKTDTAVIRLSQQEAWLFANDVITDSGIESGDEQPPPHLNINEKTHIFIRHIQHGLHEIEPFHCGACCSIQ